MPQLRIRSVTTRSKAASSGTAVPVVGIVVAGGGTPTPSELAPPPQASSATVARTASVSLVAAGRAFRSAIDVAFRLLRKAGGRCSVVDDLVYNVGHNVRRPSGHSKITLARVPIGEFSCQSFFAAVFALPPSWWAPRSPSPLRVRSHSPRSLRAARPPSRRPPIPGWGGSRRKSHASLPSPAEKSVLPLCISETGREVVLNRGEPFPMASTYKVPIAVQLLTRVDSGAFRLDSMITIRPSDLHPGSGTLTQLFNDPGVSLSIRNLLELMLLISDNSATDIMLRTAGGGALVNARLRALDVSGISVDRPTVNLIADAVGVKNLPPENELTPQSFGALARAVSSDAQKVAAEAFYRDRRDTSTPEGMARLLETIWRGRALSKANTDLLLDIMRRCETGPNRIKGLLTPDIVVRHKTGTLGIGVANDVGIIELPNNAGHIALAVFVKESTRPAEQQERAIAQIARAAYDYFLFSQR